MKSARNLVFALLLALAATANVTAGEIPIPPAPDPSPTRATVSTTDEVTPSLDLNASGETVETSDYLLFEALEALLYLY